MADFTYNDYLLHKVVQPFSLRGQHFETSSLKRNIPLYLTRQAGKVREKLGNLDSKQLITKQAVQLPQKFLELEQQFDLPEVKRRGIDTNLGLKRDRILPDEGEIDGKDDAILRQIKNRIAMEKYEDDFFVLTEAARQTNVKKAEKLSVGKQIKTVLQEKVNEDQLKKLYRKYILETMKKNISVDKKTQMFSKQHEIHGGSLQFIEKRAFQGGSSTDIQKANHNTMGSSQGNTSNPNQKLRKEETLSEFALIEENEQVDNRKEQINPEEGEQLKHDKTKINYNNNNNNNSGGRMGIVNKTNSMMIPSVRQVSAEISSSDEEAEGNGDNGHEAGISKSSKQNLQRLREINKKQQQYKQNNKLSDKNHIKNICQYFDLSILKLFKLEDKIKGAEQQVPKKLSDISLNSEDSQPEQDLFDSSLEDEDENNNVNENNSNSSSVDSSFRRPKKIKQTNLQENLSGQSSPQHQFNSNKPQGDMNNCSKPFMQMINKREDDILYDRIRYENEENLVNEQDEQIIRKVINLENQQELYSRYVQKKKKKLELEYLIGLKEGKGNSVQIHNNNGNNNNKLWANNSTQGLMNGGGKQQLQEIQEQSVQENAGQQENKQYAGLGKSSIGQTNNKSSNINNLNHSSTRFIQIIQTGQQQDQKMNSNSYSNSQRQVKLQKQPSNISQKLLHQSSLSSQQSPQFQNQNGLDKSSQQQKQQQITSQSFYMGKTIESTRNIKATTKQNNEQSKSQFDTSSSSQLLPQVDNVNSHLLARRSYNSYRLQDGKPIHEQSVLAFLKSDYKLTDQGNYKMVHSPKLTMNTQQSSCSTEYPQRRLSKSRLDYLSTPKYGIDFENSTSSSTQQQQQQKQVNGMLQRCINNNISKQKYFISATQSPHEKTPQSSANFCTARKENKEEVNKMKSEFLKFFDSCFEKKHEFQEEKHALRMEISDWYCNSQADLNRLFTNTGPKLSTLSPEFKAFIEQKSFQKKLFNYLINSMEPKDRQMAVYMYKQDRQLDDM